MVHRDGQAPEAPSSSQTVLDDCIWPVSRWWFHLAVDSRSQIRTAQIAKNRHFGLVKICPVRHSYHPGVMSRTIIVARSTIGKSKLRSHSTVVYIARRQWYIRTQGHKM